VHELRIDQRVQLSESKTCLRRRTSRPRRIKRPQIPGPFGFTAGIEPGRGSELFNERQMPDAIGHRVRNQPTIKRSQLSAMGTRQGE
jgi:hypothetical protein